MYVIKNKISSVSGALGPSSAWDTGLDKTAGAYGSANIASTYVDAHPTDSDWFKKQYQIVHQKEVVLRPGETHQFDVMIKANINFDMMTISEFQYYRNITHMIMFTARGTPVDDSNSHAAGNIMLSPVKLIGFVKSKNLTRVRPEPPKITRQITTDLYPNLPLGEYTINEETGTVVNVLPATAAA